jgi:hypothetical protein
VEATAEFIAFSRSFSEIETTLSLLSARQKPLLNVLHTATLSDESGPTVSDTL